MTGTAALIAALAVLTAAAAPLLARALARRPRRSGPPDPTAGGDLLVLAVLGFLASALIGSSLPDLDPWGRHLLFDLILAALACALILAVRMRLAGPAPLGLSATLLPGALWMAPLAYAALFGVLQLVSWANEALLDPEEPILQKTQEDLLAMPGPGRAVVALLVVTAVPFFEEVLYRGLFQGGVEAQLVPLLGRRRGTAAAVFLAAAVFTLVHPPFTWIPIGFLALVLCGLYAWTGNLWLTILVHGLHNLASVTLLLLGRG